MSLHNWSGAQSLKNSSHQIKPAILIVGDFIHQSQRNLCLRVFVCMDSFPRRVWYPHFAVFGVRTKHPLTSCGVKPTILIVRNFAD
ncbi:MAG: hypothetical protein JJT94_11650 [Bernardetiaceae bacterium]|nr:hypothetical protein [Bernardetiaceae bacterium]